MVSVLATGSAKRAKQARGRGKLGVHLFGPHGTRYGGLGEHLLDEVPRKLSSSPTTVAWDFLSIALAVYAADRFVLRRDAQDGWTRAIALEVEVVSPAPWNKRATEFAAMLRFLTGDIWHVRFLEGGVGAPQFDAGFEMHDSVCLFSGGLDSLVGAADLLHEGGRPLLVSQGARVEIGHQSCLAAQLGVPDYERFDGRVVDRFDQEYEPSMRARSMLFLGYGAMCASTLRDSPERTVQLTVPENGLIALNPPLTMRRIGSLSTRTTHPHFLSTLQTLLNSVGLGVRIDNPYRGKTKGEMIRGCEHSKIRRLLSHSYSCGKGKRLNQQCGRCVPCLIRRAAFNAAGVADRTEYFGDDLRDQVLHDDVHSLRVAATSISPAAVERWIARSGPLPRDPKERALRVGVAKRGLDELRNFLGRIDWP